MAQLAALCVTNAESRASTTADLHSATQVNKAVATASTGEIVAEGTARTVNEEAKGIEVKGDGVEGGGEETPGPLSEAAAPSQTIARAAPIAEHDRAAAKRQRM
jgi:hypothetical protein